MLMMTRRLAALSISALLLPTANANAQPPSLIGTWTVDLRPSPTAPPYLKRLVITAVEGGQLSGHFYDGSPLQAGRVNMTASAVPVFAFFTDPGEGVYQSAGRWVSVDRIEGMTLSTTRGFLLPWTATRDAAP